MTKKAKQPTSARSAKSGQFVTAATAKRRPATTVVETRKMKEQQILVFVDRIEEGVALVIPRGGDEVQFELPLKYLPPGTTEGDALRLSFEAAPKETALERARIEKLRGELT